MSSLKRFFAGATAIALAVGTTLAGAGVASAQDEGGESTGSLSSSSLDLGDTAADLELAATALNGPVTVAGNDEGGPTVTYLNETGAEQRCVGFTMPYSTVEEEDIDPDAIGGDIGAALPIIDAIEAAGDVSVLNADENGDPVAYDSEPGGGLGDEDSNGVIAAVLVMIGGDEGGVTVADGETIEWTATQPADPAAGVAICVPDPEGATLALNFGIDPQVVADQINGRIPGGSLEVVSPDMISGGSVETGAMALGSLAGGGAEEDPPVEPVE